MMRSMFAAISGLKVHQTMLDVDRQRHRQRQHARLQVAAARRSRTRSPSSSAAPPAPGRRPRAARTRPRSASACSSDSIDNLMSSGALQTTGNVLDVAIQGEGWFRVAGGHPPGRRHRHRSTRARATSPATTTATSSPRTATTSWAAQRGRRRRRHVPATSRTGATNVPIGQDGSVTYVPAGGGARDHRRLPLAGQVRQRGRPRARLQQPLARLAARAPRRSASPAATTA